MKRTVLTVALCVGVLGVGLATSASATDPFKALDRRVNRLERQIDRVQGQLLGFEDFFFACVVPKRGCSSDGDHGSGRTGYDWRAAVRRQPLPGRYLQAGGP
jgi:hypothetical protein